MSETIPSWARIGQKIVCVDDAIHFEWRIPGLKSSGTLHGLTAGVVYTVRSVGTSNLGVTGLRLEEITRNFYDGIESVFAFARFRPLVSQSDDIATHFAHLLDTRAPETV